MGRGALATWNRPPLADIWAHLDGCRLRDRDAITAACGTALPPEHHRIEAHLSTTWDAVISVAKVLHRQGVRVRLHNYSGEDAFGIWAVDWCPDPDSHELKTGTRPEVPDPFDPITS